MSRIVLAWELGANYGYISQFLPIARKLRSNGHEVLLAVRELHHAQRMMTDSDIPTVQAPLWLPTVNGLPEPPLNYAEMLLRFGYHDPQSLSGLVSAWRTMLKIFDADAIVVSHAPTALLAARTLDISSAALGTGFSIPPQLAPSPNMRPWANVPHERLKSSDDIVLKTINTILQGYKKPELPNVTALFDVDEQFLCTWTFLDHYPNRQDAHYWGPIYDTQMGDKVAWPEGEGKRILMYLEPSHRDFSALLEAIGKSGDRALVCAPGISSNFLKRFANENVRIFSRPIKFQGLLDQCDLATCHTGHGTTAWMLMAGVPLLMFPNHLEQYLLARNVQNLGAGLVVNLEAPAPNFSVLLKQMLENPEYKRNAQQCAKLYSGFNQEVLMESLSKRIEEIAAK